MHTKVSVVHRHPSNVDSVGDSRHAYLRKIVCRHAELCYNEMANNRRHQEGGSISQAGVVKLADTPDLGSGAFVCAGSSPVARTIVMNKYSYKNSLPMRRAVFVSVRRKTFGERGSRF